MSSQGRPEDLLSDMFRNFTSLGGSQDVGKLLSTLMRNSQINILKQLRRDLDITITKLTKEGAVDMAYDESLDPYKILDVEQTATREDIDKAFKKKAWTAHPDHGGSNDDMIKVNAAYEAIRQFRGWR